MGQALGWVGWGLLAVAAIGSLYTLLSAVVLRAFFAGATPAPISREGVTILKPLHGREPELEANLVSFLGQRHDGAVEMVCGAQRADDPVIGVVERLRASGAPVRLVIDPTTHGANAKVSNLVNIARSGPLAEIVVLSDSDIAVGADYLAQLCLALDRPGVGAVSCLYGGRGDAGFWSLLAARWPSWQFLPGAVFGVRFRIASPCMGSTIALRRETLERIGGFERFVDILADDHAIGRAVEALGLSVAVPPMLVTHASDERSFGALWRHELRWAATVRDVAPLAYAGSVIAFPFPVALIGAVLHGFSGWGLAIIAASLGARLFVATIVRAVEGQTAPPLWLLPLRDLLSFTVFAASFFTRSVDWRGARLRMERGGRIAAEPETKA